MSGEQLTLQKLTDELVEKYTANAGERVTGVGISMMVLSAALKLFSLSSLTDSVSQDRAIDILQKVAENKKLERHALAIINNLQSSSEAVVSYHIFKEMLMGILEAPLTYAGAFEQLTAAAEEVVDRNKIDKVDINYTQAQQIINLLSEGTLANAAFESIGIDSLLYELFNPTVLTDENKHK